MDKVYFTKEEFNKLWNKLEYLGKDRFYKFVFTSKELRELYEEAENGESIILF